MTALRIENFNGMLPRYSVRNLPPANARTAINSRLLSGDLEGLSTPDLVHTFPASPLIKRAYRAKKSDGTDIWMGFVNADVDVVRGPIVSDAYDRYYWTGEDAFVSYNSLARIEVGSATYRLGVPTPENTPTMSVISGASNETRSYVYTFVNQWGEESAPSRAITATGDVGSAWTLGNMSTTHTDLANRNAPTKKNIYRTVTGQSSAQYYFVAQVDVSTVSYADSALSSVIVQNRVLESYSWTPPPDDLKGLLVHPNGYMCAFKGKELWFSVPYRPHAWPAEYALALEHNVVGLAIYNNMVVALTESQPYFAIGTRPSQIALQKNQAVEPCLSKASIAQTVEGVLYAGTNGLVMLDQNGPQVITSSIMTRDEWNNYSPSTMRGAQFSLRYIGFYTSALGIKFSPSEPFGVFSELDRFSSIDNVHADQLTGDVWIVRSNSVYRWEPPNGVPTYYRWLSKEFDAPKPINLGACIVKSVPVTPLLSDTVIAEAQAYNDERIESPLDPLNWAAVNCSRAVTLVGTYGGIEPGDLDGVVQTRQPVGGSPLFVIANLQNLEGSVILNVYADKLLKSSLTVRPNETMRLPSGFKAHTWQFELIGNLHVYSFAAAETARELEKV